MVRPMSNDALRLAVIIGSTREGRFAPTVARWFLTQTALRGDLDIDLIDLAEIELPAVHPARHDVAVAAYVERIDRADAYVVITPEYNHGYPASLKHAIDIPHAQWRNKAVGFVSYGGMGGGLRAVEQLRQVFAELHVATVRDGVSFHMVVDRRFDEHGEPFDAEGCNLAAATMLDELAWWGRALRAARRADEATAEVA
jgi:NAD(P)H-dependent FMN reductase